jgi:hypothetical protein
LPTSKKDGVFELSSLGLVALSSEQDPKKAAIKTAEHININFFIEIPNLL